ncbi:substrate-binding domain-containing protein [Alloacidobacterium dinghuense]|uniref:Substrate-binding domain-containing protein n=1 Tax=Alloacidobacterium dinghuense TaxID=2763107 RepID=A0A7G8BJ61_9BACT|nr:substrate-binding domain-containing protein [Alloacidobacterium dinghuense]QNI32581.1 substrate-binding domain-containing protein [Alloacidobacterium dinghuense]
MRIANNRDGCAQIGPVERSRISAILLALILLSGCGKSAAPRIAVIPRTTGTMMWEPEHGGALAAALSSGTHVYWNAPTREDDIHGQIAIVDRVAEGGYQGLILAPDHALALVTPVRRAISRGLRTVIIGSPLAIPPGGRLWYVLNDEDAGGRIAAQRVASILHGEGSIAIVGIDPDISGIMDRARSMEQYLAEHYPRIRIVANKIGSFNVPHEQQVAEETLKDNPDLDAVISLNATSTRGVLSTIRSNPSIRTRVIAFDPDSPAFDSPNLDSLILQDTRKMGAEAVRTIVADLQGQSMPTTMRLEPVLVTRENVSSEEVHQLTSMDWRPAPMRWKWSVHP